MRATFISRQATDLTAVNAARVSMGKQHDVFDDSDTRLLAYLYRENHFTPFTHQRETFDMRAHNVKFAHMSETDTAGMVKSHSKGRVKIRHSIYGWVNLIKKGLLDADSADDIAYHLHRLYPHTAKALGLRDGRPTSEAVHLPSESEQDHRFIDVTLHIKAPFFVARQEFKHIVGFARNEVSRRYVDSAPGFIVLDWRERPSGNIKQGSGERLCGWRRVAANTVSWIADTVARWSYNTLLWLNVAPEQARSKLNMGVMTEYHLTGSLAAFKRLVDLRIESHAQVEIQELAHMIVAEINDHTLVWL